jgi:hypothetical protein
MKGEAASADLEGVALVRSALPKVLKQFDRRDVFNMDETGLCYKALPSRTLTSDPTVSGFKLRKDRMTISMICNMEGEQADWPSAGPAS